MRKIIPIGILFLFVFSSSLFSQGVRFTVFADPQIAWLKPEVRLIESAGVRVGFNTGFEMDYFFSDNYAFSTGLSLNRLGGKLKFKDSVVIQFHDSAESIGPEDIVTYKLQYLNLPLGLKFTTREIGYSTFYAKMGMGGHFNIKSNADIGSLGIEGDGLKDEIEFFNLSYHFGAGIQYSLGGQTAVTAGFEYIHRFIDIASNQNYKAILNSVSLRLGLVF